jgi:uncharacterized protein YecE (DUF72 family)
MNFDTVNPRADGLADCSVLPFYRIRPKVITHDKHLVDVDKEVQVFLNNIEPLHKKTLALIIQLPPSMEIMPGLEGLRQLVPLLDKRFRYAVEVRHQSFVV